MVQLVAACRGKGRRVFHCVAVALSNCVSLFLALMLILTSLLSRCVSVSLLRLDSKGRQYVLSHTLTITCTWACCCDGMYGAQDLTISCSLSDSLSCVYLAVCLDLSCCLSDSSSLRVCLTVCLILCLTAHVRSVFSEFEISFLTRNVVC